MLFASILTYALSFPMMRKKKKNILNLNTKLNRLFWRYLWNRLCSFKQEDKPIRTIYTESNECIEYDLLLAERDQGFLLIFQVGCDNVCR